MPEGSPATVSQRLRAAGFWLLVVAVSVFPYSEAAHRWCDPFSFPAATVALLVLFWWRWRKDVLVRCGIPRRVRDGVAVLCTLVVLYVVIDRLVTALVVSGGDLALEPSDAWTRAGFLFQALNEEVLLGFLPLMALRRRFGRPVAVAVGVAALFAVLHIALYRWGGHQTGIRWETGVALLAVGVLRNALILAAKHVGFAWALHVAWNLTMFAGHWRHGVGGPFLSEPELFDSFVGHPAVAAIAGVAALGSLLLIIDRRAG